MKRCYFVKGLLPLFPLAAFIFHLFVCCPNQITFEANQREMKRIEFSIEF